MTAAADTVDFPKIDANHNSRQWASQAALGPNALQAC